jgi:LmbE family N-acetylglucosaminyl deacetylase
MFVEGTEAMNVLAVASHPDDIEFGCGGTLAKFARQGYAVYALVLTKGDSGGAPDIRQNEQQESAKALGIKEVFWGNFVDTRLPFYDNIIQEIEKVVVKTAPSFVFVHHGKDTHQDHRHVNACTVVASRNIPNVLFYEGPTSFDFEPNVFVNVERFMEAKLKALASHESQVMRTNVAEQSIIDIARATAIFRGTQCRRAYAEAFVSLRMLIVE